MLTRYNQITYTRPLEEHDWTQFDRYARLVRSIDLTQPNLNRLSSDAVESLLLNHQLRCQSSFLPNLNILRFGDLVSSDAGLHLLLLGPRIKSLQAIWGAYPSSHPNPLCSALEHQSPNIRDWSMSCLSPGSDVSVDRVVRCLKKAERIVLSGRIRPHHNLVVALKQLENLEQLRVTEVLMGGVGLTGAATHELGDIGRAAPKSMQLPSSWCTPSIFTPRFAGHRLLDLAITVISSGMSLPQEMLRVFQVVGSSCAQLRHLSLMTANESGLLPTRDQGGALDVSTVPIAPLLQLCNIQSFALHDRHNILLPSWYGCRDLLPLAWKSLFSFIWRTERTSNESTLGSLGMFAGCGRLDLLLLPIDTTATYERNLLTAFKSSYAIFHVGGWAVFPETVVAVAEALTITRGELAGIHRLIGRKEAEFSLWEAVEQKVQMLSHCG